MAEALTYGVLGPLEVIAENGRRVDLGRPKQRTLLAVLLIEANHVVPLDRLIGLLWPDEKPSDAVGSVHGYISNLRHVLEPGHRPRVAHGVITTQAPGYVLAVSAGALDSNRFEALLADGHRLATEHRNGAAADCLDTALDLWRGPAFAEFALQPFMLGEATRLEELRLVAIEARTGVDLAIGRTGEAVAHLEHLVVLHPLRERLRALLALALYRSGRQADALRSLQALRTVLRDEVGIDPGPALQALEADILAQSPSLQLRDMPPLTESTPVPAREPPARRGARVESWNTGGIVDRDAEVAVLDDAVAAAGRGHGVLALVSGEPGIGTTRLAEEMAARAGRLDALVLWGRCYDGSGAPAFWPWTQVVKALVAAVDEGELRDAFALGAAAVASVFPELQGVVGESGPPDIQDPETVRFRAYQALVAAFRRVGERRPLLVILEDLHWGDAASFDLLQFLAGSLDSMPLVVLATYRRSEATVAGHPFAATLAALARRRALDVGPLRGLSTEGVAALMEAELGIPSDPEQAATVHARTDGNPFFIVELIRLMRTRAPPAHRTDDGADDVPTRVRDVVRGRLARLPEGTNAVLELASVIGREFELDVLETASGLDLEDILRLLDAALVSGLVSESTEGNGRYRFSHALVQEVLYRELHGHRRARLHLRVAEAMEALPSQDEARVSRLAHHFACAATSETAAKAVAYAVQAADIANRRYAYERAFAHLRDALDLVQDAPPGRDRDGAELGVQLRLAGWTATSEGWIAPGAAAAWARARQLARTLGDVPQLLGPLWGQWVVAVMGGRAADAAAVAGELVELGERTGDLPLRMAGACTASWGGIQRGDLRAGLELADLTAELAGGMDDAWLTETFHLHIGAHCLATSSWPAYLLGDEADATARAEEGLGMAYRIKHPYTLASALVCMAVLHVLRRDLDGARRLSQEAIEVSTTHGIRPYVEFGRAVRGWTAVIAGDVRTGLAELEDAVTAIEQAGWALLRPLVLGLMAEARWSAGRAVDALATLDRALDAADVYDDRYYEPELHRLRGDLLAACWPERRAEAESALRTAARLAEQQHADTIGRRVAASLSGLGAVTAPARTTERQGD